MHASEKPEYFTYHGVCPTCRRRSHILSVGRNHFGACDHHRLKWWVGANIFSDWRDEDEATWRLNHDLLSDYTEVEPYRGALWQGTGSISDNEAGVRIELTIGQGATLEKTLAGIDAITLRLQDLLRQVHANGDWQDLSTPRPALQGADLIPAF